MTAQAGGSGVSGPKINLIHIVLEMSIGGLQRLITDMTLAMDRARFNVEVICLDDLGCFAEVLQSHGIAVHLLRRHDRHLALSPLRLAKFLRARKAHIIHMHPATFIFGALASPFAGRPVVVYTEHGRAVPEERIRVIEDRVSAFFVDRIIAVSKDLELYLVDTVKLPAKKICTVINGICVKDFQPRSKAPALLQEFGIAPDAKVLGTVARIDNVKDQLTMVKAFALARQQVPQARLLLVGDGPLRGELEAYARSNGLADVVQITGQRNDVPKLLNLLDIFVLSSLREGTSISLLEAMASGVAPIVTKVGGNPAIVAHGVDGLLVEPQDPEGLGAAMVELLTDDTRRRAIAERATRKVHEEFSIETMARKYVAIYYELLQRRRKFRHLVPAEAARRD